MTKDALIHYCKKLLAGNNDRHLSIWLEQNKSSLQTLLSRQQWLKLKFSPFKFSESYLQENNINFQKNQSALNKEKFLFLMQDCVNDNGELDFDKYRQIYNGLPALYFSNQSKVTDNNLQGLLDASIHQIMIATQGNADYLTEDSCDFLFFIETTALQYPQFSLCMIDSVKKYFDGIGIYYIEIDEVQSRIDLMVK